MAKGITISLAAKCQLLFGLAVLVIIAGALAVPWQRMEQLATQPNVTSARLVADLYFRQIHQPKGPPTTATGPADPGAWDKVSLLKLQSYPPPHVVMVNKQTQQVEGDEIARQAIEAFRTPEGDAELHGEFHKVETLADKSRIFRYAAAIRLEHSCLACHKEYTGYVRPEVVATMDASSSGSLMPQAATLSGSLMPRAAATEAGAATQAATSSGSSMPQTMPQTGPAPNSWPVIGVVRFDLNWQTDENQLLLNRIVIVVSGMLGGTLAIVVFFLITSRLILQPVRVLRNTADKVSKGDLNIRSAISTGDEFEQLSNTFNTMLATLKASQDQLESTNRSLDTRVGELAQSNIDLYEANKIKSEFLTNVSHELRTPLNAIIGFAELLADNPATKEPKLARYVDNVRTSAKQLLDLINDLLDLAKIEAGKLVLRQEKVNVSDVCEALVNFMKPLAGKKNIDLEAEMSAALPLVTTDPGRFQQILYNFLSNAIKFTPNEGVVRISAKPEYENVRGEEHAEAPGPGAMPGYIRIAVTDSGPGIAPEHQQQIFEKFRQIDGSVTRQHSGSGLGLAISKELAGMLGGRIELMSVPGKGAVFTLILPVQMRESTVEVHASMENL